MTYPTPKKPYIGPDPDQGSTCDCGRAAKAKCEGCAVNFCERCWWRHSHTKDLKQYARRGT